MKKIDFDRWDALGELCRRLEFDKLGSLVRAIEIPSRKGFAKVVKNFAEGSISMQRQQPRQSNTTN